MTNTNTDGLSTTKHPKRKLKDNRTIDGMMLSVYAHCKSIGQSMRSFLGVSNYNMVYEYKKKGYLTLGPARSIQDKMGIEFFDNYFDSI